MGDKTCKRCGWMECPYRDEGKEGKGDCKAFHASTNEQLKEQIKELEAEVATLKAEIATLKEAQ